MLKEVSITDALKKKYPESVSLVSSVEKGGKTNLIPLGWFMQTSLDPPMIAISVGKTRYSHKLISETKEFVFMYPGIDMESDIIYCGTHSGKDVDKIKELKLKTIAAKEVKAPLLEKALACLECKVKNSIDTGDHTIFSGQVLRAYTSNKDIKKLYTVNHLKFGGF